MVVVFTATYAIKHNNDITVKPVHVVTSIKSNLSMRSPLLSQTCPCGHLLGVLNRGDHMDRLDCNIIVMFVFGMLNRGDHMDRFD
jgi:hypothetical protein